VAERPLDEPRLIIEVPFEGDPRVLPSWSSAEDAARLKANLQARPDLPEQVANLIESSIPMIRSRRRPE
jgi:hypothetical protein